MFHPSCTSYAQGGSRVKEPLGPGNAKLDFFLGGSTLLGGLTVPIVDQIAGHLATTHGNKFSGTEIVFVLAGANDVIVNTLNFLVTVVIDGKNPVTAKNDALQAMTVAGTELAGYVNNSMLGNGAQYVVVLNVPALNLTPFAAELDSALPGTRALINELVAEFNSQLAQKLTSPKILLADLNTASAMQIADPKKFGLTNVTSPACDLSDLNKNPLESSLACNNATNVILGDISRYAFADMVHPTPWGNRLIADFVALELTNKGWL